MPSCPPVSKWMFWRATNHCLHRTGNVKSWYLHGYELVTKELLRCCQCGHEEYEAMRASWAVINKAANARFPEDFTEEPRP